MEYNIRYTPTYASSIFPKDVDGIFKMSVEQSCNNSEKSTYESLINSQSNLLYNNKFKLNKLDNYNENEIDRKMLEKCKNELKNEKAVLREKKISLQKIDKLHMEYQNKKRENILKNKNIEYNNRLIMEENIKNKEFNEMDKLIKEKILKTKTLKNDLDEQCQLNNKIKKNNNKNDLNLKLKENGLPLGKYNPDNKKIIKTELEKQIKEKIDIKKINKEKKIIDKEKINNIENMNIFRNKKEIEENNLKKNIQKKILIDDYKQSIKLKNKLKQKNKEELKYYFDKINILNHYLSDIEKNDKKIKIKQHSKDILNQIKSKYDLEQLNKNNYKKILKNNKSNIQYYNYDDIRNDLRQKEKQILIEERNKYHDRIKNNKKQEKENNFIYINELDNKDKNEIQNEKILRKKKEINNSKILLNQMKKIN